MHTELQDIKTIRMNVGVPANIKVQGTDNPASMDIAIPAEMAEDYTLETSQKHSVLSIKLRNKFNGRSGSCKCDIAINTSPDKMDDIKIDAVKGDISIGHLKCHGMVIKNIQGLVSIHEDTVADTVRLTLVQSDSNVAINSDTISLNIKSINGTTRLTGHNVSKHTRLKAIGSKIILNGSKLSGNIDLRNGSAKTSKKHCYEIINGKLICQDTQYIKHHKERSNEKNSH